VHWGRRAELSAERSYDDANDPVMDVDGRVGQEEARREVAIDDPA
jgi:hypothetical protein